MWPRKNGEKICVKLVCWAETLKNIKILKINIHQLPVIYLTEKYLLENRLFTEINESSVICP